MGFCMVKGGLIAKCGGDGDGSGGGDSELPIVGNTGDSEEKDAFPKVELLSGKYSNVLFDVSKDADGEPTKIRVSVFYV